MEHKEENIEIRKKLLNLPKFKASENFLNDIYYKINKIETEGAKASKFSKEKTVFGKGIFANIFSGRRSPWLVPAMGFSVVLILVFSVVLILNKSNIQNKDKVITQTTENAPTQTSPNTSSETLKKDNSEGKKIEEDLASGELSSKTTEEKYTDQGKVRMKTETQPAPEKKLNEVRQEIDKSDRMEVQSTEKADIKDMEKGIESKVDKKAETSKKDEDVKTGKLDEKKKETKKDKDVVDRKAIQGANEIDKNSLQNLKDKIEKGLK